MPDNFERMFLNIANNLSGPGSKVIFFTGNNYNDDDDEYSNGKMIEVVDVLHPTLDCDTYGTLPVGISNAAGGKIGDDFIVCGGKNQDRVRSNECYILGNEEPFINMNDKRADASGVVLPNGTILMIGEIEVFKKTLWNWFCKKLKASEEWKS